ncbi:hypothetical protein JL720_2483 [Aureococcus anophagefferens]|nr:hypothetical protein JL720_2483 [Aureococcus anophagefferens]
MQNVHVKQKSSSGAARTITIRWIRPRLRTGRDRCLGRGPGGVRKHYDAASALSGLVEAAHDADAAASHVRLCVDAEGPGAANLIIDCVRLDGKFHCVLSAGTEPVIVVHWSNWQFPRDVQRFVQALQATDDGSQMTQISASAGALAGVVRELEANAAAIAPDFLARRRPPGPHEDQPARAAGLGGKCPRARARARARAVADLRAERRPRRPRALELPAWRGPTAEAFAPPIPAGAGAAGDAQMCLVAMARILDAASSGNSPGFALRDRAAGTRVLLVVPIGRPFCRAAGESPVIPVSFAVRDMPRRLADAAFAAFIRSELPGMTGAREITPPTASAVEALEAELALNQAALSPSFVAARQSRVAGARASVLAPLGWAAGRAAKGCLACGRPATKACSRCKAKIYCSATCQRSHWPAHKQVCAPPEDGGDWVDVDPSADALAGRLAAMGIDPSGCVTERISLSGGKSGKVRANKDRTADKEIVVKVSNPMPAGPAAHVDPRTTSGTILIYDEKRKTHVTADPDSFAGGRADFVKLFTCVHRFGGAGEAAGVPYGLKAYLRAYVTEEGKLRIFTDRSLPLQPW